MKSYQNAQNVDSLEQLEGMLPMQELRAVQVLLEQEKAYARQKSYLDHSVSMQLDPEQIAQRDLIYNIKMEDPEQGCLLTQLYVDLINSTAMYQWIEEKDGNCRQCCRRVGLYRCRADWRSDGYCEKQ